MQKVCLGHDHLFQGTGPRCELHKAESERARERVRGDRHFRGYGAAHDRARAIIRASLPRPCEYGCGTMLHPEGKWVAAHRMDGRPEYGYLASCVGCNERAKRRSQDTFRAVRQPGVNAIAGQGPTRGVR